MCTAPPCAQPFHVHSPHVPPVHVPALACARPCERRVGPLSARVRRLEAGPQLEAASASEGGPLCASPHKGGAREAPEAPVARPADQGSLQARLAVLEGLMGTAARVLAAAPQDAGADAEEDAELSAAATRVQAAAPALEPRLSPRAAVEKAAATDLAATCPQPFNYSHRTY